MTDKLTKIILVITLSISLLFVVSNQPINAASNDSISENIVEDELIITYKKESTLEHVEDALEGEKISLNATEKVVVKTATSQEQIQDSTAVLTLEEDVSVDEAISKLEGLKGVESVQPNYIYELLETSLNDTYVTDNKCYYLNTIHAYEAWDIAKTNQTVTVAVIDTGCNLTHEDLVANLDVDNAYDATRSILLKNKSTPDSSGHGSHVCGLIAAEANNGKGIAGTSYNAKILPINVFTTSIGRQPSASTESVIKGLNYVDYLIENKGRNDIKVINMSLGGYGQDQRDTQLQDKINHLLQSHNVLTVCAAGNDSKSDRMFPSDYEACISVEASDQKNNYASFTNINEAKDITAPGVDICSTYTGRSDIYGSMKGTSMASPIVAGVVALLYAYKPDASAEQIRSALYQGATGMINKKSNDGSHGIVNAKASLDKLRNNFEVQTTCSHPQEARITINDSEATCKVEGYTGDTKCNDCGVIISYGTTTEKLSTHTYDNGKITTSPTCKNEGEKTYTCTVCGNPKTESINKLTTHTVVIDEAKASTCTETGLTEGKHCSKCDKIIVAQAQLPALGHSYSDYIGGYGASCEGVSYTGYRNCITCGTRLDNGSYGLANGHNYTTTIVSPTETAGGYTLHQCTNCSSSYTDTPTAAGISKSVKSNKKKNITVSAKLSSSTYKKATYKKVSGSKKLTISSKGVVTVKKGTKKGIYKIKVKATVKKTKKTKAKTKTYTVTITVE